MSVMEVRSGWGSPQHPQTLSSQPSRTQIHTPDTRVPVNCVCACDDREVISQMDHMPCLSDGGMDWGAWKSECPNEDCRGWRRKCAARAPSPTPRVLQQQYNFVARQQHVVPDGFKCIGQQGGNGNGGICINHATNQLKKLLNTNNYGWWKNEKKVLEKITYICRPKKGALGCGNVIQLAQQDINGIDPWVILPYLTVNTQPLDLAKGIQGLSGHGPGVPVHDLKESALAIKHGIWAGVETLHNMGWVHNDIKPANIFLTDAGNGAIRAVIGDLGAANQIGKQRGTLTLPYTDAQQTRLSAKENDWFACVLCVYDMLCGHLAMWPPYTDVGQWDHFMQSNYTPDTLLFEGPYTSLQAVYPSVNRNHFHLTSVDGIRLMPQGGPDATPGWHHPLHNVAMSPPVTRM